MTNKEKNKNSKKIYLNTYGVLMLVVVLLLTVGYAAFGDNMSIDGTVATVIPDANIRITSVVASGNNGATVGTTDHGYHYISSSVSMPQNSTITYTVEVTNFGNEPMAIYAINPTYSPNDIKIISTSGYNIGDKICADSNPSQCTLNAVKTFTITIGYNNYGGTQAHEINLDFEFVRTYDVTYSHMTNNSYPAVAYEGKPFQVTFSGDVPADIIVSPSHNHTYQNGVLSIPNVTSDITINRYYSITYNLNSGTQANNQVTRYLYGDNLSILDPTRTNYVFQGWYESSTFTGSPVTSTNGLDRNLVLYAKWGVIYSISYVGITDSNNYPSTIASGNTYNQTFATAPSSVSVTMGGNTLTSGTDFTYSNGTLIIPNVSGNLVITANTGNFARKLIDFAATGSGGNENNSNMITVSGGSGCTHKFAYDGTADNNLRYVGKTPCNYVSIGNTTWRIIGVFNDVLIDGESVARPLVKLILSSDYGSTVVWDSGGKNLWQSSSLYSTLNNTYYPTIPTDTSSNTYVARVMWNLGGAASPSISTKEFYTAEHGSAVPNGGSAKVAGYVGLMAPSDYGFATSGDDYDATRESCLTADLNSSSNWDNNCYDYDWLDFANTMWTITPRSGNSSYVFRFSYSHIVQSSSGSSYSKATVRPVIYLKPDVDITGTGDGSSGNPYVLK